ncbi:MAG: hypothetical protein AAFY91_02540, partial [Bacteroidota bacterium]
RFGSLLYSVRGNFVAIEYDIYHRWIDSNGVQTSMETGGGGILIISLEEGQSILHSIRTHEY